MKSLLRRKLLVGGLATNILSMVGRNSSAEQKQLPEHLYPRPASSPGLPPASSTPLARCAARNSMYYGCAVNDQLYTDISFQNLVRRECTIIVSDSAMKFHALRPAPDVFDFRRASQDVDFALENGMKIRGHTLVWHRSTTPWFEDQLRTSRRWTAFEQHVRTVTAHFQGRIFGWDVVNEPFSRAADDVGGLRPSIFLECLGPTFIDVALSVAHDADPASKLYINDFFFAQPGEGTRRKMSAALNMAESLLGRGVPLHGLGLQGHLFTDAMIPREERVNFFRAIKALGLELVVTELDVHDPIPRASIAKRDEAVAGSAADFLESLAEAGGPAGILTWGLTDRYSSNNQRANRLGGPQRPLPFDSMLQSKPLADTIREALQCGYSEG